MKSYFDIADNVYNALIEVKMVEFTQHDILYVIIKQLRRNIMDTPIVFRKSFINILEVYEKDSNLVPFDFSLIPSVYNKNEFILWLATFIEKITINKNQPEKILIKDDELRAKYLYEDESQANTRYYSSCDAISDYFKEINVSQNK